MPIEGTTVDKSGTRDKVEWQIIRFDGANCDQWEEQYTYVFISPAPLLRGIPVLLSPPPNGNLSFSKYYRGLSLCRAGRWGARGESGAQKPVHLGLQTSERGRTATGEAAAVGWQQHHEDTRGWTKGRGVPPAPAASRLLSLPYC